MKNRIKTLLGTFEVWMSYVPSSNDETLKRLKNCLNNEANQLLVEGVSMHELSRAIDESKLEEALFSSLCEGGGSAPRLSLDLDSLTIELSNF